MVDMGYVPSKSTSYILIKNFEDKELAAEKNKSKCTPWNRVVDRELGNPSLGIGYQRDFTMWNIRQTIQLEGRIALSLVPVSFDVERNMSVVKMAHPIDTDICVFIGNSGMVSKAELQSVSFITHHQYHYYCCIA